MLLKLLMLLIFVLPVPLLAADILVEGRVFTAAGPLRNAKVLAHRSYAEFEAGGQPAATTVTDPEGLYHLSLPSGPYFFSARGTHAGLEYFAYHGSNPIKVDQEKLWLALMASALEAPPVYVEGPSLLEGVINYKGQPVANARVTLYTAKNKVLKGLGAKAEAADQDGKFKLAVPAGKYVVTARKNADGKYNHPPAKGDLFCYYSRNPVEVKAGSTTRIAFSCYPKIDRNAFVVAAPVRDNSFTSLAERELGSVTGIPGRVVDDRGKPIPGITVTAYRLTSPGLKREAGSDVSTKTDASGAFLISLDQEGDYGVETYGEFGEGSQRFAMKGAYQSNPPQHLRFKKGVLINKIVIIAGRELAVSDKPPQSQPRP